MDCEEINGVEDIENHELFDENQKMLPPPPQTFESREDLLKYVHRFSFSQGYATSIKDSKKNRYVRIGCDRGGVFRNRLNISMEERKNKSSSRLINCPFEIKSSKQENGSWVLRVINGTHNHEPSNDMSGHPSFRQFSKEEFSRIKEMTMAGIPPRQMITSLRKSNPNLLAISRTIYSAKAKIRKDELKGRIPIQALLEELPRNGFIYDFAYDAENCLTHLFLAHPLSITLNKRYSNVFVMDCTYKSNKFKMPLLDIIGVTSFNTSFYSSCAFLQKEEEKDYVWALIKFKEMLGNTLQPLVFVTDREFALMNAIQVVFPSSIHLLCVWYIEKNILTNCKPQFREGEDDWADFLSSWTTIVNSTTESVFNNTWRAFEVVYGDKPIVINYIKNTWLHLKERFVKAWTNNHLHFGNHVTSRAEGAHATLKSYLQVSTGDLHVVAQKMSLAFENNFNEIKTQLASEKKRIPHYACVPFFKELVHNVSVFALDKLFKQYKSTSSGEALPTCTGHFSASMGLPCAHMMRNMTNGLRLSDIHSQWRIDEQSFSVRLNNQEDQLQALMKDLESKYQQWPLSQREVARTQLSRLINGSAPVVFDPIVQPHKGRQMGSKNKKTLSSTTRDPSAFEMVEKIQRCSICKETGHDSRTCPHKVQGTFKYSS